MARRRSRRGQHSWHIWSKLFKIALLFALLGAASFYAYQTGLRLGARDIATLRQQVQQLTASAAAATQRAATLAAALDQTKKRADDYQAKYEQNAPTNDIKEIIAAVRAKLAAGLDAKRLTFVIEQAAPPRHCAAAVTKRFVVRTGKAEGNTTWVRFSDLVTVSAQGAAQGTAPAGGADRPYDPAKPVVVTFTVPGATASQVQGTLPLQHAMVAKGGEFHFTLAPGARGFIEVTGERCEYKN